MIHTETNEAENEKMDEIIRAQDEHIAQERRKSSYPKRSNVVGLWRKREEAIKASNVASKGKASESEFEEKKEGNQEIEHDSRQQDKNYSALAPHDSKLMCSERNSREPVTDADSDQNVEGSKSIFVSSPRRSNIRDSWKKRESIIPSIQSPEPSPNGEKTTDIMISASDSVGFRQSESILRSDSLSSTNLVLSATEPTDVSTSAKRSSIRNSWRKRETASSLSSSSSSKEERGESVMFPSSIEKHNVSTNTRIIESPSNASSNAFDELKSKWAKFGVQKDHDPTIESDVRHMTEKEAKEICEESKDHIFENSGAQDEKAIGENPMDSSNKTRDFDSFEKSYSDKCFQDDTKQDTKNSQSPYSHRVLASRRMGSKSFRSKYTRTPVSASTGSTNEIVGLTNASEDLSDSEKNCTTFSMFLKKSRSHPISIEKESFSSFPLDEMIQNGSNVDTHTNIAKNSKTDNILCNSFVPIQSRFRYSDPQTKTSMGKNKDSNQSPESISSDVSNPAINSIYDNIKNVSRNGSWCENVSHKEDSNDLHKQKNSNISQSSLSSRANRRLRDIRMRNQTRREEDVETTSKETDMNAVPGLSSSVQRIMTNESSGSTLKSMDESLGFSQSLRCESTEANSHLYSTSTNELNIENTSFADCNNAQRSPLHGVVPDVKEMVPDEFVSEKNANVESFKTAYDRTSFEQIANDMKEEAISLFSVNVLNEGVHSAIQKFGLGNIFQTEASSNISRRAHSPVEEVAIEVEYVADSD